MTTGGPGPSDLLRLGVLLVVLAAALGTPADADLWGHLTFGRDILSTGQIVQQDRYSFTSDKPWVNHEWLAEVVFSEAYRLGNERGLIALKIAMIALLMVVLWWRLRRGGATLDVAAVLLVIVFVGTYWRTHTVRPQLFSVLLFACLLVLLTEADAGRRRVLWIVPLLLALWVNLHGGYIVGLGILAIWLGLELLSRQATTARRATLVIVGALSLAATLVNPYGMQLWVMLAETVRLERADIQDWGTLFSAPIALGVPWALVCATAVIALRESGWRNKWPFLTIVVVLAVASIRVSRLDAFFAISVVVLLAPGLIGATTRLIGPADRQRPTVPTGARIVMLIASIAIVIAAAPILGRFATCMPMEGAWLPEPDAARYVKRNHLQGRMLTFFDWGQYAIWHFAPDLKVSMDGRRETVYSDDMIWAHWRFYDADASALPFLARLDPDYVWVPRRRAIGGPLVTAGWIPIFEGPISTIFARQLPPSVQQPEPMAARPRCFPGP